MGSRTGDIDFMLIPKFGTTTFPFADVASEIELVARNGFDFAEISVEEPFNSPYILLDRKDDLRHLKKKFGISYVAHAPWNSALGTRDASTRKDWIELSKDIVSMAKITGIGKVNFHPFMLPGDLKNMRLRRQAVNNLILGFKEIVAAGRRRGVEIVIENLSGPGQLTLISDMARIIDSVKGLGICFDSGHANMVGGMEYIKNFLHMFKDDINHIHLHDNKGDDDQHLPLGKGNIDFKYIVSLLKKSGYGNTVTFEVFSPGSQTSGKDKAAKSMEKFALMWKRAKY